MEIGPIFNTAVVATAAAATVSTSTATSQQKQRQRRSTAATVLTTVSKTVNSDASFVTYKQNSSNQNENVNNLALLASLTLQKVLNINNINNNNNSNNNSNSHNNSNGPISDCVPPYQQQVPVVTKATTAAIKLQQQRELQRQHSDNETENDVLNQLLKKGAVFTTNTSLAVAVTPIGISAHIDIERKSQQKQQQQQQQQQNGNSAQKQRLNSSISSTNSSTSTNSYGSSCSSTEDSTAKATGKGTATTTTTKSSSIKLPEKSKIPSDILDDLASRFIINVPDMELNNLIRICFQMELAHWFYLDFFCPAGQTDQANEEHQKRKLPIVGIKQFAMQLFQHIPFLKKHFGTMDQILEDWKSYKQSVPTYGAILVSEDLNHCLLVQSYFARNSWGFPKGKINEHEDPAHCATREVYEETGFDITDMIDEDDYIEALINYQFTRLYIVRNIPLDTQFVPRTRNEIKCCDWFRIDALPVNKNDAISKAKLGKNSNSFFMIIPFVKRLKKWVIERRAGIEPSTRRRKFSGQQSPKGILNAANSASPTMLMSHNNINHNNSITCKKEQQRSLSRRQRHKSMGDLDGVNFNNLNGKVGGAGGAFAASNISNVNNKRISNNNNKQLNVAAGSNTPTIVTTIVIPTITNIQTVTSTTAASARALSAGKRQLFHSQSQNDAQLPTSNEKIVSSFALIRKEKQQLKVAKAQKLQQQLHQQHQRSRAKSQSDKQSNQQQQPLIVKSILSRNNIHKEQKQQQQTQQQQQQQQPQQSTPTTGMDLIAMLTAAAAAQKTSNPEQQQHQQRPRPASVSLNSLERKTSAAGNNESVAQDAQTNLRILKRAQSQQPLAQHRQEQQDELQEQQQEQQEEGPLHFTPNFNSWTNFSFTKNFIANVFC